MSDSSLRPETHDALRRRIVLALQEGLPVTRHPYCDLARDLNLDEDDLLSQLRSMLDDGAIRRIGIVPNHYALGYTHNLMVVWDVDERHLAGIGDELGQLPFVSHCYQRPRRPGWTYNLFVMIHGKSDDEVDEKIQLLRQRIGAAYRCHTTLKSTRILKKTGLRLRQED